MTGSVKTTRGIRFASTPQRVVNIKRTRKVPDAVMDLVHSGIKLTLDAAEAKQHYEIRDRRHWGINEDPATEYCSLDWYQAQTLTDSSRGYGRQVDAAMFLRLAGWRWQRFDPPLEALVIDNDLIGPNHVGLTAAADPALFGFVISIAKFNALPEEYYPPIIRKTAAHEFGHVLGLIERGHNYTDGIYGRHCGGEKGPCLMGERTFETLLKRHLEEVRANQNICPDCIAELKSNTKPR